jgi:hypothetical protein
VVATPPAGSTPGGAAPAAATIYYRGARVLTAVQSYLLAAGGLSSATDLVVSGSSAGALAVYLHVDAWAAIAPPGATVVGLPDSGFFRRWTVAPPGGGASWAAQLEWVFIAMNGTGGVPAACVAAHASQPSACIFAEVVAPTIATPVFALQSQYDSYQIEAELHASAANFTAINAYGAGLAVTLNATLLASTVQPRHGVFLDACFHHTRYWGDIVIGGDDQAAAFAEWYTAGRVTPGGTRVWAQRQAYPCASCCVP